MSDPTQTALTNIGSNLTTIAKHDGLKAVVPVLDAFLTSLANNQGGTAGIIAQVNALGPELLAALPNAGANIVKDAAGALKDGLDAAAAKADTNT